MPAIDERLFAHIFNDPFLLGSFKLEGNRLARTIAYLKEYVASLGSVSQGVAELVAACDYLCETLESLYQAKNSQAVLALASDAVKKAYKGDNVIIPGGWTEPSGGHTMLYQLIKDDNGDILFKIHNSGAGLQYHEKKSSAHKELYNPILTYVIPGSLSAEKKAEFAQIVQHILEALCPELHKNQSIDETYVYESLLSLLAHVDGKIVPNSTTNQADTEHWFTGGQISGTCSQRSIHQMLKSQFTNQDAYRRFIYDFKMHALRDYWKTLPHPLTSAHKQYLPQIKKAICHALRLLNNQSAQKIHLFSDEQRSADSQKLTMMLAEVRAAYSPTGPSEPLAVKQFEWGNNTQYLVNSCIRIQMGHPGEQPATLLAHTPLARYNEYYSSHDVATVLLKCEQLKEMPELLIEQVEYFIKQYSVPNGIDDISAYQLSREITDKKTALIYLEKLNQLNTMYLTACKTVYSGYKLTPAMFVTKLSFMVMAFVVNYPFSKLQDYYSEEVCKALVNITTAYPNAAHPANHYPDLDNRLQQMKRFYHGLKFDKEAPRSSVAYHYNQLLSRHPSLKSELSDRYRDKYSADTSELHQQIRIEQYDALYYLLRHMKELSRDAGEHFAPVLLEFELQKNLECLLDQGSGCAAEPTLILSPSSKTIEAYEFYNQYQRFRALPRIINAVAVSVASKEYYLNTTEDDNNVQLSDFQQGAEARDNNHFLERELRHLRKHSATQIDLSLDYFSKHLEHFKDKACQIYLKANLFQPGLLLVQLRNPQFLQRFNHFIDEGLAYFDNRGKLTSESMYFLQLKYWVYQYAYCNSESADNAKQMQQLHQDINVYISDNHQDKSIVLHLHELRMMLLTHMREPSIDELIVSRFYVNNFTVQNAHPSMDEHIKIRRHGLYAQQKIEHARLLSNDCIHAILKEVHITFQTNWVVCKTPPVYQIKDDKGGLCYTINVATGTLFNADNKALVALPPAVFGHPMFVALGLGDESLGFLSKTESGNDVYTIDKPPSKVRFINRFGKYAIQKTYPDSRGQLRYFQLIAHTKEHAAQYQYDNPVDAFFAEFPKHLNQRDVSVWQGLGCNEVLMVASNQDDIVLRGALVTQNSQVNCQFVSENGKGVLLSHTVMRDALLTKFEEEQFIACYKQGERYTVDFPRYQLTLEVNEQKEACFEWQGLTYRLYNHSPMPDGIPSLYAHQVNQTDSSLCLIPIQRFVATDRRQKDSEYMQLTLDTQHQIAPMVMKKHPHPLWQYSNTEHYYAFSMENNQPKPGKPCEALYLCYLYLGANQPEKAWGMLEYCDKKLGGLSGNYDEIRYIQWMFNALPFALKVEQEQMTTPEVQSCKLKALSLLTRFKQQGGGFNYSMPDEQTLINNQYQMQEIQTVQEFDKSLQSEIKKAYQLYLRMQRDNCAQFMLSTAERKSLLEYYHDIDSVIEPTALGALGAEWVSLRMQELAKELMLLEAKHPPSAYDKQRMAEINDFIAAHPGVKKRESIFGRITLETSIPEKISINRALIKDPAMAQKLALSSGQFDCQYRWDVGSLRPGMSDDEFLKNFSGYLTLASNRYSDANARALLKQFCYSTLVVSRYKSLDKQKSNMPLLCNILYRILEHKDGYSFSSHERERTFDMLIRYAKKLPNPVIEIDTLYDKADSTLLKADEIFEQQKKLQLGNLPVLSLIDAPEVNCNVLNDEWLANANAWHLIETGIADMPADELPQGDFLSVQEWQQGHKKFAALTRMQELANQHFSDEKVCAFKSIISSSQATIGAELQALEGPILTLANQKGVLALPPSSWALEVASLQRKKQDINRLLRLFFQNNQALYQKETGLNEVEIKELHANMARFVQLKTQHQQLGKIQKEIQALECASDEDKARCRLNLANTSYAKNVVQPFKEPDLAVYQLHAKLLIRPTQKEAIKRLLAPKDNEGYQELIERIIMGGGKSKVLMPTLAYKKATGNNLVVVEVPHALLRTNYIDLKSTSIEYYDQQAVLFEFNRHSDCRASRLKKLFLQFTDVRVNKQYLVTTNDALQSLELKYLELLNSPPSLSHNGKPVDDKAYQDALLEWQEQITWANKILCLLRERSDVLIDEVHHGLLLKNKLNYTVGESQSISRSVIKDCIELYRFFRFVSWKGVSLFDVLKDNSLLNTEDADEVFNQLAAELTTNAKSPLKHIADKLNATEMELLKDYLSNRATHLPGFIGRLNRDENNQLALYKEQINHLLPHSLRRNLFEHYGPSKKTDICAQQRALAIPYVANNKPNERSRFGNYIETINYTIQAMLLFGVSLELLKTYIELLQVQARQEAISQKINVQNTPSAKLFKLLLGGGDLFALEQIDVDNDAQLASIHSAVKYNEALIYDILDKQILGQICLDAGILHSDAYNHVGMLRSCQGMSGTPFNHQTFHHRLTYDASNSQGLDALVYQVFNQDKNQVIAHQFKDTAQAIRALFNQYEKDTPLRALIDICAMFKGVPNLHIAQEIAKYLRHPDNKGKFCTPSPIRYVMYFNDNNEITALPLATFPDGSPIVIGSSDVDVINARLNCTPDERFTIYDQDHTVGVDITQGKKAKALVMVDDHTHLSHFFQGIMRMRGLIEGEQSVDVVVPVTKEKSALCAMMAEGEHTSMKRDNFAAAYAELDNVVRNNAMKQILDITGDDAVGRKQQLFTQLRSLFILEKEDDLFKLYGIINTQEETNLFLTKRKNTLLERYQQLMNGAFDSDQMDHEMTLIIDIACQLGRCEALQETPLPMECGNSVEVQQEVQVEIEKEMQQHLEVAYLCPKEFISWEGVNPPSKVDLKTLETVCQEGRPSRGALVGFSNQIKMTSNFYASYNSQTQYLNMYSKPVHALLFKKVGEHLECIILSPQECLEVYPYVLRDSRYWLSTTSHTVLAGTMPTDMRQNAEYQEMIEQIRYFNGEWSLILKEPQWFWINKESDKKIDFFEQNLLACRETRAGDFGKMKGLLTQKRNDAYQFVISDFRQKYTEASLLERFKELHAAQVKDALALAEACHHLADDWETIGGDWYNQWALSLDALGFLQIAQDNVADVKKFLNGFVDNPNCSPDDALTVQLFSYSYLFKQAWQKARTVGERVAAVEHLLEEKGLRAFSQLHIAKAKDPDISQEAFDAYVHEAKSNPKILLALMTNPTDFMTPIVLSELVGSEFETILDLQGLLSPHVFLYILNHPLISEQMLSKLENNPNATPIRKKLITCKRELMGEALLRAGIVKQETNARSEMLQLQEECHRGTIEMAWAAGHPEDEHNLTNAEAVMRQVLDDAQSYERIQMERARIIQSLSILEDDETTAREKHQQTQRSIRRQIELERATQGLSTLNDDEANVRMKHQQTQSSMRKQIELERVADELSTLNDDEANARMKHQQTQSGIRRQIELERATQGLSILNNDEIKARDQLHKKEVKSQAQLRVEQRKIALTVDEQNERANINGLQQQSMFAIGAELEVRNAHLRADSLQKQERLFATKQAEIQAQEQAARQAVQDAQELDRKNLLQTKDQQSAKVPQNKAFELDKLLQANDERSLVSMIQSNALDDVNLLQMIVSRTEQVAVLLALTNNRLVQEYTQLHLNVLEKLFQQAPHVLSKWEVNRLLHHNKLSAQRAIVHYQSFFELEVIKELLNKIVNTIKLAFDEKITSNRYILFASTSKVTKDAHIDKALLGLNLALAKNEGDEKVMQCFKELCQVACLRRNKLSALVSGQYSTETHSAKRLVNEFLKTPALLQALDITTKEELIKAMNDACLDLAKNPKNR